MTEVLISGLYERIEGRCYRNACPKSPLALILQPNQQECTNSDNLVTRSVFNCFVKKGFSVLSINFPENNKSNVKAQDKGNELSVAAAALDWWQAENPTAKSVWIAGFSFGAWVTLQLLMRRPEIDNFIVISLPANKHDFSFLYPCPTSGLILHGEHDSIIPMEFVTKFVNNIHKQKGVEFVCNVLPKADHFFRGKLDQLSASILAYMDIKSNKEHKVKIKIDRRKCVVSNAALDLIECPA